MTKPDWPALHDRAVEMWARGDEIAAIAGALGVNALTLSGYMRRHRAFFPKRNRSFGPVALRDLHGQIHTRLSETGRLSYSALRALLDVKTDQLIFILRPALADGQLIKDPTALRHLPVIMAGENFDQIAPSSAPPPASPRVEAHQVEARPAVAAVPSRRVPAPRAPAKPSERRAQIRAAIAGHEARRLARYGRHTAAAAHERRAVLAESR